MGQATGAHPNGRWCISSRSRFVLHEAAVHGVRSRAAAKTALPSVAVTRDPRRRRCAGAARGGQIYRQGQRRRRGHTAQRAQRRGHSAAVGCNQTRVLRRRQPGEQIAVPEADNDPALRLGARVFSPRATEEGKATEGHRATNRPPALARIACLSRWPSVALPSSVLSVRNLAGCCSGTGRPWQNATSPARHSNDALAPGPGRTSEPEPTKSAARLKSARLARIFQVNSAEKDRLSTSD